MQRYNKFTITDVAANPNPAIGQVSLKEGWHEYNVYEQDANDPVTYDPTGLNCVEEGICRVRDTTNNTNTYYDAPAVTNTEYEQ